MPKVILGNLIQGGVLFKDILNGKLFKNAAGTMTYLKSDAGDSAADLKSGHVYAADDFGESVFDLYIVLDVNSEVRLIQV